jgi:hypothetical protein
MREGSIYRVGVKIKKIRIFFRIFWSHNGQKRLVFQFKRSNSYSDNQISIQMDQSRAGASLPPVGPSGRQVVVPALLPGPAPARAVALASTRR